MFKFGSVKSWEPKVVDGGFVLTSTETKRILRVTAEGVSECDPDGAPVHLIDCSPAAHARLTALTQMAIAG